MSCKKFDVIIFGASGFVGKCAVLHALEILKGFKWAIAGKSEHKLKLALNEISLKSGHNLENIPIFVANANDTEKLETIIENSKVVVNCCGPYQLSAEDILTKCIIKQTHYVDMCNDPHFNELMELKYHEKALNRQVFVISACGFHSFPIEMALNFLKQNFEGTINSVEAFVRYNFGCCLYFPLHSIWTTSAWLSLIWSCWKIGDLATIRDQLRDKSLPNLQPKQQIEELSQRNQYQEDGIMVHIPFIDQQTVERSQYMFYSRDNERPLQFAEYMEFPFSFWAFLFIIWSLIVSFLAQFEATRKLLNRHPKLFSFGTFTSKKPMPYFVEMSFYKIKLCAKGWSCSTMYPKFVINDNYIEDSSMNIEISGENPFYGCACVCLLISARCILEDLEKLPGGGGVLTPGYAFQNINILEKFQNFSNYLRIRVL